MAGYLFVHFIGEEKDGEQIYFALSKDGHYWRDLNNGEVVLRSTIGEKGVRDPFIIKDEKQGKYYLIATDLRIEAGKGWGVAQDCASRDLIVWESEDLVHWSKERACTVGLPNAGCVWAPEVIYDITQEAFFVFWSSKVKEAGMSEGKFCIYGAYTKDFHTFGETFKYMERNLNVIDMNIIYDGSDYYRFVKDEEVGKVIMMDRGKTLDGVFEEVHSEVLAHLKGVEGPECFKLQDDRWCLMVDQFAVGKGYLPLVTDDLASGNFEVMDKDAYDLGKTKKRHGGIMALTDEEYDRLQAAYTKGNPVIEGLYADPDIAVFDDTYYIYPTTDGYTGWSGTSFAVFSSPDGRHFTKAATIFDVATDVVPWAVGSAWAPCIATKAGKYYFYFCAKRSDGKSCIGVAVADQPEGPFRAAAQPMLTPEMMQAQGIEVCQTIDPSVYEEDGHYYILFGNGQPVIAMLAEDMLTVKEETLKNIVGAFDFREAITVLKRGGEYHFTWSCDDTGSENYHVNYGTADSVYGPITYHYPVLEKQGESLGTGHHSIVKVPGKDTYQIAYHRFAMPLARYGEEKGCHRETCIAPLAFDETGKMCPVKMQ